jgi:hypothetical protein
LTGDDDQAEVVGTPDQLRSDDSDDSYSDDFGEIRALLMSNVEAGPDLDVAVHLEDDEETISGEVDAFKEGFSKVRLDTADQEWLTYSRIEIDGLSYDIIDISTLSMDQVEDFPMAEEERENLGEYLGVIEREKDHKKFQGYVKLKKASFRRLRATGLWRLHLNLTEIDIQLQYLTMRTIGRLLLILFGVMFSTNTITIV